MSFQTLETSVDDGNPVELLQILYSTSAWNYTTAESEITYNSAIYTPYAFEHTNIAPTGDASTSSIDIKLPKDAPVGELYRIQPPTELVTVSIFGHHYDDDEFTTLWKGRITNVNWNDPWLTLTTESIFSSLQRIGLRRRYSVQCPYALYGNQCLATRDSFKFEGTVTAINGISIVTGATAGKPDGYFAGGYMSWVNSVRGNQEYRMIRASAGGAVTLSAVAVGLAPGQLVSIYAGCDHLINTCANKFNNSINFGGTPYIPKKNPFGGSTIY